MRPPPRFSTLPRPVQFQVAGLGPLLVGAVCGFLLESSAAGYWIVSGLGVVGGIAGGLEHRGARAGARRGLVAGILFGIGIVAAHAIAGREALAPIPSPSSLLVLPTAVAGALLGAAGGAVRLRWETPRPRART